jgi:predicted ATPase
LKDAAMLVEMISVKNFRAISQLENLPLSPINVFFGPNGSGKSTLLDTLWFLRDCAIQGATRAANNRNHGIGLVWDGADAQAPVEIEIKTRVISYQVSIVIENGKPDVLPGESLSRLDLKIDDPARQPIFRKPRSETADLYNGVVRQTLTVPLREADKLSVGLYLAFNPSDNASVDLDYTFKNLRQYSSRSFFLYAIKSRGCDAEPGVRLSDRAENLWSVLRNLNDKRDLDERFDTIMHFMRRSFPGFSAVSIEQTGSNSVSGRFLESHLKGPMSASGMSDGHIQMLILLTAIFSEGIRPTLVMFDEPDLSLNPWAIQILAEAIQEAADNWNSQFLIATHSPVLLSMFNENDLFVSQRAEGQSTFKRLVDVADLKDLLGQYAAGSLYMMQLIGEQSQQMVHEVNGSHE